MVGSTAKNSCAAAEAAWQARPSGVWPSTSTCANNGRSASGFSRPSRAAYARFSGLGLACALDLRVGAAGARLTTAFAGIGLTADSGLSWTLPRLVGAGRAAALLLLAEPFTTEQALEMGLLNIVVPPEQVLPVATELAVRLAAGPTAAYACIKESVAFGADSTLVEALGKEDELQTRAGQTSDHVKAVKSFLAKEIPTFEGR